ncbi:MAG TPA: amino acid ABC transporter permease [Ktedonobacterales bacterium]|nr:amino acid ABC transporter permease [Ktedonobacterales bacterium]
MGPLWNTLVVLFPKLVSGVAVTIAIFVFSAIISLAIAIPVGLGRTSRFRIIRALCTFYVETIRGTPLFFQLLVWFFGIQVVFVTLFGFNADQAVYSFLTSINSNSLFPTTGVSGLFFGIIGLSVNYGAYMAEVIRAGVQSVEHGQTEAALSLGLSRFQTSRFVILPQALRIMIPPLTNNLITLVQDTAIVSTAVVGTYDLELVIQTAGVATSDIFVRLGLYTVELGLYFLMCYPLALISRRAERRTQRTMAGAH